MEEMTRDKIAPKYKWDLSHIFKSQEEFDLELKTIPSLIDDAAAFKGKLGDKDQLFAYLQSSEKLDRTLERLYFYGHLKSDLDLSDSKNHSDIQKVMSQVYKANEKCAFVTTELSAMEDSYLNSLLSEERFSPYDRMIKKIIENRPHILSEKEEQLLSGAGEIFGGFQTIFEMTDNADLKFPNVLDDEGNYSPLNHSRYALYLSSKNKEVRKGAYEAYYKVFADNINHITATYAGSVKKDAFMARVRNFSTSLEAALFYEEVSKDVYEKLLENISKTCPKVHDYISLRKKVLGLDEIHFYDLYTSMIKGTELSLDYEDAVSLVKEALTPLGEEYQNLLTKAFSESWVDVYATAGKRSGAYSSGIYGFHPHVLLNYEKTSHDVFTIAHELGHCMHSYYSSATQHPAKSDYVIFVAEVASTVNEVLLLKHLIKNTKDKEFKKFCLNYFLDMFRTTIFRQTMFAEFEAISHNLEEKGEPLTKDILNAEYEKLNKKYYGEEIIHDEFIKTEWCRIPHFYRAFYVYKYATGLISAITIATGILEKGEEAVAKYKEFLKSGASLDPVSLLKIAGVDLTTNAPFEKAMSIFAETLEELKGLF